VLEKAVCSNPSERPRSGESEIRIVRLTKRILPIKQSSDETHDLLNMTLFYVAVGCAVALPPLPSETSPCSAFSSDLSMLLSTWLLREVSLGVRAEYGK
jgi:hypothetical protein